MHNGDRRTYVRTEVRTDGLGRTARTAAADKAGLTGHPPKRAARANFARAENHVTLTKTILQSRLAASTLKDEATAKMMSFLLTNGSCLNRGCYCCEGSGPH